MLQDYDAYCQRVIKVAQSPCALRATWLKGGIVWCIMREITGKFPQPHHSRSYLEELQDGPSGESDHYQGITIDSKGRGYYDDGLSSVELDVIAGVFRVYTGKSHQTHVKLVMADQQLDRAWRPDRRCLMVAKTLHMGKSSWVHRDLVSCR